MRATSPALRRDLTAAEGGARWPAIGQTVDNRRQLMVKICWMLAWMLYLAYPIGDLVTGGYSPLEAVLGWAVLVVFLACYLGLVTLRALRPNTSPRVVHTLLATMCAIATAAGLGYGQGWICLFCYASVAVGAVLPAAFALRGVVVITACSVGVALLTHASGGVLAGMVLPTFLSGAAMTGLQRLAETMRELREARETVAHLAAAEERLRLARDLHDLLGHSLSLITLKSELAGRFMDQEQAEAARTQVADIERVARQSLVDVREAVSGYRRPTLPVELSAARSALATAGITLEAAAAVGEDRPGLGTAEAGALAWVLREAVTNIVRHAVDATVCAVTMDETWDGEGGRFAVLQIADDGRGPGKSGPGNGLSGLDERLALVGGRLESGPGDLGRGFRLRAVVPLGAKVGEQLAERALSSDA
ncbi:sensor histidine kinase [Kitasatospora sp. NPDC052896]|uniref:sensor histidine kinase n=1 Tax=Kitasatospora sp. NPDC052896 TaxID=3364061 RepID=UPI0037CC6580